MALYAGTWRLRCRNCLNVFDINVGCDDELRRSVQQYCCPQCLTVPRDRVSSFELQWHEILDFYLPGARGCRAYPVAEGRFVAVDAALAPIHGH